MYGTIACVFLLTPVIGGVLWLIFQVVVDIFVQLFDHRDSTMDTKLYAWNSALDMIITCYISNSSPRFSHAELSYN